MNSVDSKTTPLGGTTIIQYSWKCMCCGVVYAPWISSCNCQRNWNYPTWAQNPWVLPTPVWCDSSNRSTPLSEKPIVYLTTYV